MEFLSGVHAVRIAWEKPAIPPGSKHLRRAQHPVAKPPSVGSIGFLLEGIEEVAPSLEFHTPAVDGVWLCSPDEHIFGQLGVGSLRAFRECIDGAPRDPGI